MSFNHVEQQRAEIETIKERTITFELSDADCERIFHKTKRT